MLYLGVLCICAITMHPGNTLRVIGGDHHTCHYHHCHCYRIFLHKVIVSLDQHLGHRGKYLAIQAPARQIKLVPQQRVSLLYEHKHGAQSLPGHETVVDIIVPLILASEKTVLSQLFLLYMINRRAKGTKTQYSTYIWYKLVLPKYSEDILKTESPVQRGGLSTLVLLDVLNFVHQQQVHLTLKCTLYTLNTYP